ncbi:MAG: type II toxin-antitoxin system PemK/MazF family toxin [Acidobacteria bacterium]|jgi:mRNA interferase MazF|nr:type II toxin-antitoxin system PemK/MazF family toxin [Acidobacteriota bacterium]
MVITQGDVFWARLSNLATGSEPENKRPVVVVQRDSINRSKFNTVVVVPLTRQTKHVNVPGNVLLLKGDANLPRQSLARTTHIMVIDKSRLIEKIGTLSQSKTMEIISNIMWILGEEGNSAAVGFRI